MNKYLEQFYQEYDLFEKIYLPEDEQERLNSLNSDSEERPFEKYSFEPDGEYAYRFFTKIPLQFSETELNNIILIELLKKSKGIDNKQKTIRNILILWCVLLIIGFLLALIK